MWPLNIIIIIIRLNLASFCWCYHYFSDLAYSCISLLILHLFLLTELFQQRNELIPIQNLGSLFERGFNPSFSLQPLSFFIIHSLIQSFIHWSLTFLLVTFITHSLIHSVNRPFIPSVSLSLIHSSIHSFIHSFIHSSIHSFIGLVPVTHLKIYIFACRWGEYSGPRVQVPHHGGDEGTRWRQHADRRDQWREGQEGHPQQVRTLHDSQKQSFCLFSSCSTPCLFPSSLYFN